MKRIILISVLALNIVACAPKKPATVAEKTEPVYVEMSLKVTGMHCDNCEASIAKGVNELAGIDSISANHMDSTAFVRFDSTKTNLKEISEAIVSRGFTVK